LLNGVARRNTTDLRVAETLVVKSPFLLMQGDEAV
jgi:hypothetical protein